MNEERSNNEVGESRMIQSRMKTKRKNLQKSTPFQINLENYLVNKQFSQERMDPKGLLSNSIYVSFSGVIKQAQMFTNIDDLKVNFKIVAGQQWHDQTPQINVKIILNKDTEGQSIFCQSKNKKVVFSLGFDCFTSCMYIISWPQLVMTFRSFDFWGQQKVIGYSHIFFPSQPGYHIKQAYIYSVINNKKWYHNWIPFLTPNPNIYQQKDFDKTIVKGYGRQTESVRAIGKVKIQSQILIQNYTKFGYR